MRQLKECEGFTHRWRSGSQSTQLLLVSMFIKSHLHIFHSLTNVAVAARAVPFVDCMWSVVVFVLYIEKAFVLFAIVLEIREIVNYYRICTLLNCGQWLNDVKLETVFGCFWTLYFFFLLLLTKRTMSCMAIPLAIIHGCLVLLIKPRGLRFDTTWRSRR